MAVFASSVIVLVIGMALTSAEAVQQVTAKLERFTAIRADNGSNVCALGVASARLPKANSATRCAATFTEHFDNPSFDGFNYLPDLKECQFFETSLQTGFGIKDGCIYYKV